MKIKIMSKNLRLGMRTTKTAIAIFICLLLGLILNYKWPAYACIAAIVSMQDTPMKSLEIGKARLVGTGIGGALGIIFLWVNMFFPNDIIRIILSTLAVVAGVVICDFISQRDACAICAVVVLIILLTHGSLENGSEAYIYSITRIIETAVGVIISFLINRYIWVGSHEHEPALAEN